ncbi:hypothetical protein [Streptomyces sp. LS1784]|nr:hypothetical protein [Streptomyces sp. LS1784]
MRSRPGRETGADEEPDDLAFGQKAGVAPAEEAAAPGSDTPDPLVPARGS